MKGRLSLSRYLHEWSLCPHYSSRLLPLARYELIRLYSKSRSSSIDTFISNHVLRSPVFILSNVLLLASPPALTLAQVHVLPL